MTPRAPRPEFGRSPLTDPRSLGVSAVLHVAILAVLSIWVLGVGLPNDRKPAALNADVRPVDNRAPEESGGSPGSIPSTESVRLETEDARVPGPGRRNDAASALLSETIARPSDVPAREALPVGPATTGGDLLDGEGLGGGSGGGVGGGIGKGIGPGTEFFGATDRASSFAFVIDCSGSMSHLHALQIAKAELLNSLDRLPPDARFGVIFYSIHPTVFPDPEGRPGLMSATRESKTRVHDRLAAIGPGGGTDHARALRAAFALKPEVVFFLTDADRVDEDELKGLRSEAGSTRIQAVEFGDGPSSGGATALRDLATSTGGTFRHVDLSALQASRP